MRHDRLNHRTPPPQMISRRFLPSLSALQAFEAAARHGSFSRAAEELNLTQGAVSRQVRGLENALGIRLFELVRQRVILTELGRRYLEDVRRTIDSLERSSLRAMAMAGAADIIDLAALPTFGSRWLIPRLPSFYANHPDVTLNCTSRFFPFDFRNEPFDAAIHFGPPVWPGAVLYHLFNERMLAVCSPAFRDQHHIGKDSCLADVPLLQQSTRPSAWADWFEGLGSVPRNAGAGGRYDQFSMIAQGAAAGLGAALLPEFLIEEELATGKLVVAHPHVLESGQAYFLVIPEEKTATRPLAAFRTWLMAQAVQFRKP